MTPRPDETFARLDTAAEVMDQAATELEAAAALVGLRERLRRPDESPAREGLVLTSLQAYGLSQILELIADQLRRGEAELRGRSLKQTG